MNPDSITITIPATSANLGPGFDAFGVALQLANQVTLQKEKLQGDLPSIAAQAAKVFFEKAELSSFPFSWHITGDVPSSRGLGSSVTVRLGILLALNELSGRPLTSSELYHLCATLEGHADNTAPALLGGFTIARAHQEPLRYEVSPDLRFVLLIPNFEVATTSARKLLPSTIATSDAAANAADAAVIAVAFATGQYQLLRGAFHDRLHQPFRQPLVPFLPKTLCAAESAGALGGWLSGSGSTIAALAENESIAAHVALGMKENAPEGSRIIITSANNEGGQVMSNR